VVFNEDKTRIVHAETGFDFLGFNVRRYRSGKLLIKPKNPVAPGPTRTLNILAQHRLTAT
jgi:hypothetical protein